MIKVLIIGGGFAGLSALAQFKALRRDFDVTLVDKKNGFDFLPMLPDILGARILPEYLSNRIDAFTDTCGAKFVNAEVIKIDLDNKRVFVSSGKELNYDYLVIASGSETNFYGNESVKKYGYKLDSVSDAEMILKALAAGEYKSFLISGAGYTGIEVATNIRRYLNGKGDSGRIIIVEKSASLLGPLPQWMKDHVFSNLKSMGIEFLPNCSVEKAESGKVYLTNSDVLNNAMLIWAAGVRVSDFILGLNVEKNTQGRMKVDDYLRVREDCFVAGDAAYFQHEGKFLRMAVQFSIVEGSVAARNVINSALRRPFKKYKPVDLGYIIPLANNNSCGTILGRDIKGVPATMMHFSMCIFRCAGFRNKIGVLKNLINNKRRAL